MKNPIKIKNNNNMFDVNIKYWKNIPEKLIIECEEKAEDGNTYFIFDNEITDYIEFNNLKLKEIRDKKIDKIIEGENKFYIDTIESFKMLPSRFSFYDTETKYSDRYERYAIVVDFIKQIGFKKSVNNLGLEMDQVFNLNKVNESYRIIVKPNMFINITYFSDSGLIELYDGFFNKKLILDTLKNSNEKYFTDVIRDIKLKIIGISD